MMGNVAGVGQLLETVGLSGPQVGVQTVADSGVPGQDFAAAMQQAAGPAVRPASGGYQEGEASAPSKAGVSALEAQGGSVKVADPGKSGVMAPSQTAERGSVPGQSQARRSFVVGTGIVSGTGAGSKPVFTSPTASGNAGAMAQSTAMTSRENSPALRAGTTVVETPVAVSLFETQSLPDVPASVAAQGARVVLESAAAEAGALKSERAAAVTNKSGQDTAAGSNKPAEKASVSATVHSKLTALVPQGAVIAALDAGLVGTAATAVAPVPQTVFDAASAADSKPIALGENGAGKPVLTAAVTISSVPARGARVQSAAATQGNDGLPQTIGSVAPAIGQGWIDAASSSLAVDGIARQRENVAASTGLAQAPAQQAVKPALGSVGPATTLPNPAASTALAQAGEGQRAAGIGGAPEQGTGALMAVPQTPRSLPGLAAKAGTPGLRGMGATSPAVASVASSPAGTMGLIAEGAPAASARVAALPVTASLSGDPTGHAGATTAKDAVVAAAQRVQASGTPTVKPAASADGSPSVTAVKVATEAVLPAAAVQPASAAVEPGAGFASVAGVPMQVAHEAVSGTLGTGSAAGPSGISGASSGSSLGTQETGGTGLSHTTLSSTPTSLEVGVSGGTHGWLKIRAELNATGEVSASLTGATPAATDKLRGELPALNNYLQGERVAMGTVDVRPALHAVMTAGESGATFSQMGSEQGSAHQGNSGQGQTGAAVSADAGEAHGHREQQMPRDGENVRALNGVTGADDVVLDRVSNTAIPGDQIELGDSARPSSVGYEAGGGRLNVRA